MSYPTAPGYEAYAAAVGQSYPLGNQGYHTSGMQQQMPSQAYTSIQNALQAAVLEAQQQQQQQYAMANQNYYQNATAAAYQAAAALQQEQQQKLFEQQLQQQLQLQQQYARQAQMYQNYPTQAYFMPYTSYVSYQQVPGFPASRSYGAAQTGYPPNGTTGFSASWPVASTSTGGSCCQATSFLSVV
nr:vacuolar protein-sorting-associated protein 36-like [Rhipicephalus microplus]